jgi:hypothetical protein
MIDVAIPADINVMQKVAEKKTTIQVFIYRDKTNVLHEMYDFIGHNFSQRNGKKSFVERFGSHTRNTFSRFTKKESCTWNITNNKVRTAV